MTNLPDEIGRLAAHLIRRARTDGGELAITATQRLALTETALHSPLRLRDLAERMGVSDATASRAVETLVGFGLVERTPDPNDRRAVVIEPTAGGRKRFGEQRGAIESALRKLPPADRKQLTTLLARLNDALD